MKLAHTVLAPLLFFGLVRISAAFEACDKIADNPEALARRIGEESLYRTPVKYHAIAREIKLVTSSPGDALIPFAAETGGTRVIVFPLPFAKALCNIVHATVFVIEDIQERDFALAAKQAGQCFENGQSQKTCLTQFSNELAERYQKAYSEQPNNVRQFADDMFSNALSQVAAHEYAHHFLGHFTRVKGKEIERIDAEFEADYFSIVYGVQHGEAPSAMFYFFKGLADIEQYTDTLVTREYESALCRATNVENITRFMGAAPILLLDAAAGGGYRLSKNSPEAMEKVAREQFGKGPPATDPRSCGKLAKSVLNEAYTELKQLYLRAVKDRSLLLAKDEKMKTDQAQTMLSLVGDLSAMAKKFRHMNGLAAKSASFVARRVGWYSDTRPVAEAVDRLIASQAMTDNLMSEDYGRFLQTQGLSILQERTDLPAKTRLERSRDLFQKAVFYNDKLSEVWMNLAFIAFMKGDCASGSRFSRQAAATAAETKVREQATFFAAKLDEFSRDPKTCQMEGAKFRPYPGL